ncbi:MAG TPA: diheme cytochrome c-553 [Ferruginibacter sp.]|nr:diheme cytochrome c-553 [Ferruginibacter sp.]HNF01559.1 diheme cytochrome c-553 [Ferruginibacter sp.]HNF44119.1 diheme cytochrome c-553 [Ferruginibacter sp.]HNG63359.1 diheme cytochrome c-553 [Ferruginibacter sp.]HNH21576.1 diheme cytochrome c-553 [Ferruginibacter sp.]
MRTKVSAIILGAVALTTAVISCDNQQENKTTVQAISNDSLVKRGAYLVNSIGCDDCHSPKKMGPHGPEVVAETRFGGFLASNPIGKVDTNVIKNGWAMFGPDFTNTVGPWGMSFAANISSDETGIGNWSEQQFITALRKGKLKGLEGSRDLLPPMPWFVYKNLTDEDLRSIYAYLKTTKPVKNVVPAPKALADL